MVVVVFPLSPFPPDLCPHGTRKRESNGALDFDGFCWMGGRNNQPKVGQKYGIYFWVTARRAMTIGEAADIFFTRCEYDILKVLFK